MPLGRLAGHIAEMLGWGTTTLGNGPTGFRSGRRPAVSASLRFSREQLLGEFDKGVAAFRTALPRASDQDFMKPWTLLSGGKIFFTMLALRSYVPWCSITSSTTARSWAFTTG